MNPTSVVTTDQLASANAILSQVFQGVIDFLYTIVTIFVDFFTQPAVLGALAVIAIVFGAYRMLKRKSLS
jgi:hypothetical protein